MAPTLLCSRRRRAKLELPCLAYGICGDQFRLLVPNTRAREHPRGTDKVIVSITTHDGRVPVAGERNGIPWAWPNGPMVFVATSFAC
jgi:hypothetical protein